MSDLLVSANNSKVRYCQNCIKSPLKSVSDRAVFKSSHEFFLHLREYHCTKEGGSFACLYGPNGVCPSLPLDGVSELDYQDHVWKDHLSVNRSDRSYMAARLGSQNPSTDPSVVQDQHKWTIYMSQINLPALLNDPRLNRRESDFFTKTWGESFDKSVVQPSQFIPCITRDHFQQYLLQTTSRRRCRLRPGKAASARSHSEVSTKMEEFDAIPKIFFGSSFSLLDRDTFYQVLPWSSTEKTRGSGSQQQRSPKLLQEKLSHYLDLVEVQITKQISAKSDSFFEAMLYQNTLQDNLQKTCKSVQVLRDKIRKLDDMLALQPLQVTQKCSLRSKYQQIHEKLKFMATVQQTQPTIQLLLSANDFMGALDLISTTQEVLSQELAGIQCFRHLGSQLSEMKKLIVRMTEEEFSSFVADFFDRPVDRSDLEILPPPGLPLPDKWNVVDEERLALVVLGLYRSGGSNFLESLEKRSQSALRNIARQVAVEMVVSSDETDKLTNQLRHLNFQQWLDLLTKVFISLLVVLQRVQKVTNVMQFAAKMLVCRESTVEVAADASEVPTFEGDKTFRAPDDFQSVAVEEEESADDLKESPVEPAVLSGAGAPPSKGMDVDAEPTSGETVCSKRVDDELRVESEDWKVPVCGILKDCDPILSEGQSLKVVEALNEHLCRICEHAHDCCYKLFNVKVKDGFLDRLSMSEFLGLSQHIGWLVSQTERICGRRSSLLRGTLLCQAIKLVNKFHEERKNKLCLILDNERWKQADVPCEFQDLVNHIQQTGQLSLPTKKLDSGRSQEFLYANGGKYIVVGTALMLLKLMVEYCEFADKLPFVASEILSRLVELLKTFNSRTCQLILGAGALHLVGLKTISTRNLGLASRCLQLMLSYFPIVKLHFHERLHNKHLNMIKHFEHLHKDYRDHIAEISVKLVSIMDSVLQGILNKYEIKSSPPSQTFKVLLKQTTRFHEAISDLLPAEQVQSILGQFHLNFARNLKRQLNALNFSKDSIQQLSAVEADLKYYITGMQALPDFKEFSMDLEDIFKCNIH